MGILFKIGNFHEYVVYAILDIYRGITKYGACPVSSVKVSVNSLSIFHDAHKEFVSTEQQESISSGSQSA